MKLILMIALLTKIIIVAFITIIKALPRVLRQGFVGGADFSKMVEERFILENRTLDINFPISSLSLNNIDTVEQPKVKYPYRNPQWFNEHRNSDIDLSYVIFHTVFWIYKPIIGILPDSEYGMLGCAFAIHKVSENINVLDNQSLKQWLNQKYDESYYQLEPVDDSRGKRAYLRQKILKIYREHSPKHEAMQLKAFINSSGYPLNNDTSTVTINDNQWVFHQLVQPQSRNRTDMYCLGLDEQHFLVVRFKHHVDRFNKHKKWRNAANKTQQRVMQMVSLTDYIEEEQRVFSATITE